MTESSISAGATEGLTILGSSASEAAGTLETFPNRHPGRRYTVTLETSEFTCVCPMDRPAGFRHTAHPLYPRRAHRRIQVAQAVPVAVS